MKYSIKTYGCQMNYSDSERIAGVLETAGYEKALSEDSADLIIINACSVRQSAINKISGRFKKYKKLKKINPDLKIVLTGCVLESDRKKFEKMFDLIVGIGEMEKMCWFHSSVRAVEPACKIPHSGSTELSPLWSQRYSLRQNKFSAYVPIMTGCNNFCSYCVVPYTRGREYSRPAEEIINEVTELIKRGYKEIILLGQNVNSYEGKLEIGNWKLRNLKYQKPSVFNNLTIEQFNNRTISFSILLKLISDIPGDFWIRFLTSHPKDMSEELIKIVAECEKVTPYIHIALQSGDDEILKKMNRKYTAEHFLGLVKMIRKYIPNVSISTDIIIGFPGETERQFQNTVEIMKKAKFDMAYLNKYSPRAGTAAEKLNNNVSRAEKKRREKILTEVLRETALENNEKYVGKTVKVLPDETEINKLRNWDTGILFGKTENFKNVRIDIGNWKLDINGNSKQYDNMYYHTENLTGKFLNIKITQAGAWGLEGEMME